METILAVDDELSVQESYRMILGRQYHLIVAADGAAAMDCMEKRHVDLLLLDLTMPKLGGMDVLRHLEALGDATPVLVVTGSNRVDTAVEAMKLGARDFVAKPFDVDALRERVEALLAQRRERRAMLARQGGETQLGGDIVGDAPAWRAAIAKVHRAMAVNSTVLLTGETGTGKDVLAKEIHRGSRPDRAFVPLSCCAIPRDLIESELFGAERGAYTGASEARTGKLRLAHEGTLFLDEIGEMPLEAQAKLLRVLQDGGFYPVGGERLVEVDVRFICATNRPFGEAIAEGRFRSDLYYRINVLPIEVPALRARREDIPALIGHFIEKHGARVNTMIREVTPRALSRLMAYDWPGNVRELENTIERVLVCYGNEHVIDTDCLAEILPQDRVRHVSELYSFEGLPLQQATQQLEQHLITRALRRCNYVQSRTAEMLGTTRRVLKYKMDQLEIEAEEESAAG